MSNEKLYIVLVYNTKIKFTSCLHIITNKKTWNDVGVRLFISVVERYCEGTSHKKFTGSNFLMSKHRICQKRKYEIINLCGGRFSNRIHQDSCD
eukprot:m.199968 g.199968  ORF g.199968 m.199968 type:complete len:94 (+) comp16849_c0_seq20:1453-1734(+)